jgi:uncharacterized protein
MNFCRHLGAPFDKLTNMKKWEKLFRLKIETALNGFDPAHDLLHFERVVKTAKEICLKENGKWEVVVPAAWLHDFVIIPKNDPRRSTASKISAIEACKYLDEINYPKEYLAEIAHAIEGHSYSANIDVTSLEAKIVQDADRLDAIGAIGIARCFATSGMLKTSFYHSDDPFCLNRLPDDSQFTLDHFYIKLFKIVEKLNTESGRKIGEQRLKVMNEFFKELKQEIS